MFFDVRYNIYISVECVDNIYSIIIIILIWKKNTVPAFYWTLDSY